MTLVSDSVSPGESSHPHRPARQPTCQLAAVDQPVASPKSDTASRQLFYRSPPVRWLDLCSVHRLDGNTVPVPLYACESCGYTSAAFRLEAARVHRLEYPECDGVIRIIFRSEERYRGSCTSPPSQRTVGAAGSAERPSAGREARPDLRAPRDGG